MHIRKRLRVPTLLAAASAALAACGTDDAAPLKAATQPDMPALRVEASPAPGGTRLMLVAPPGIQINTYRKPVLVLTNGAVVQFDTSAVSPDSTYFAAPPAGFLWMPADSARGILHASICDSASASCRRVRIEI